jgi:cobyrinic acid a,c-diamide synthase
MSAPARGLIIASPASGCGKTTVTLGLLRAFADRGLAVSSFKVGPDYIDPAFHAAASGRPCRNLDGWAMRDGALRRSLASAAIGCEMVIGEGVMGLFDGAPDGTGSTADIAATTGLPIVLVVDAVAQAASAAALVHGFASFREDVTVAGVIFNRVSSEGHARAIAGGCGELDARILGFLPTAPDIALPERHLGLVQAREHAGLCAMIARTGALVAEHIDVDLLGDIARPVGAGNAPAIASLPALGQRIAVAEDEAFAFAYPHVLEGWRAAGAEIVTFSPLGDQAPPADADAVYLPGGYPELHAGRLAAMGAFLSGLRAAADRRAVLYGECGGYMVLGEALIDGEGERHAMAGLLPVVTSFAEPRMHFGYRRAALREDGPLGKAGGRYRAHEFHHAGIVEEGEAPALFACTDALGADLGAIGQRRGSVMGSFIHLIDGEPG